MSVQGVLGVELPIIQAPMAGVQNSELAISVSEAGGLGSLPCAMLTLEKLEQELTLIASRTTRPVNLNFFCHRSPVPDTARERQWRDALSDYYVTWGVDESQIPAGPGRLPFSEAVLNVIEPFAPSVVSFHFGLPKTDWLDRIKAWGGTVLSSATTVDEAIWLERHGADAVVAQGIEAGGHRGMFLTDDLSTQCSTIPLLVDIVHAVSIPVIAAGGIARHEQVSAALAAGAVAAQVGTAYLLCPEATTSAIHRRALASDAASDTYLTNLLSGRPARGMMNRLMADLGPLSELAPEFPLATGALVPLRAAAEAAGYGDFSPLWCGTDASGCCDLPAALLTRHLAGIVG